MSLDRLAAASVLEQIASFFEFQGENPFRVRAFRNAARTVQAWSGSISEGLADGSLAETRGIGPGTVAVLQELQETGRSSLLERLRGETPPGLLEMLAIPGLGATRVRTIHQRLGIATVTALEAAARDGRLARLHGFGAKTAEKVLKGIAFVQGTQEFRLWHQAAREAEVIAAALTELPGVSRVIAAGELRRRVEVVGELGFVAQAQLEWEALRGALEGLSGLEQVLELEPGLAGFRAPGGIRATLRTTAAPHFGAALVRATGSPAHWERLAARAGEHGLRLEAGRLLHGERPVGVAEEEELYQVLGLPLIPPELREGLDEVELAARGALPRLLERGELRGLLHCHTTWSDGKVGAEQMALAAREAGYEYIGITDHSRSASYAGGLAPAELPKQWAELDALNHSLQGIRVLKGIEADILDDGVLDYDDATLAGFDFVIGSVHSRLSLDQSVMTSRLLRAFDSPYLTILGHPTGRLLLARRPYPLELDRIFGAAAELGVALELNGDPHRLDLDWRLVRRARELGVTFCLGADAHSLAGIGYVDYALGMARKGGLGAGDVLNTRSLEAFLAFARARRP